MSNKLEQYIKEPVDRLLYEYEEHDFINLNRERIHYIMDNFDKLKEEGIVITVKNNSYSVDKDREHELIMKIMDKKDSTFIQNELLRKKNERLNYIKTKKITPQNQHWKYDENGYLTKASKKQEYNEKEFWKTHSYDNFDTFMEDFHNYVEDDVILCSPKISTELVSADKLVTSLIETLISYCEKTKFIGIQKDKILLRKYIEPFIVNRYYKTGRSRIHTDSLINRLLIVLKVGFGGGSFFNDIMFTFLEEELWECDCQFFDHYILIDDHNKVTTIINHLSETLIKINNEFSIDWTKQKITIEDCKVLINEIINRKKIINKVDQKTIIYYLDLLLEIGTVLSK